MPMLYEIANTFPHEILDAKEPPFISLYQPTHRYRPENKQDLIRYKNLVRTIEESLRQKYPKREIETIMAPFYALAKDKMFWNNTYDGLAILANKKQCVIYKLQRPVRELAVVADSFHIKPLIRIFQSADRYHVLGLNRKEFALYEGNRYGFEEVQFEPGTPQTIEEVLEKEYEKAPITPGVYGDPGAPVPHSYDEKRDKIKKDTEKFFRFIDRFVFENYSRTTGLPLMIVGLPEYHTLFKNISRNPFLIEEGVKIAYDALTIDQLREKVWEAIEPRYLRKTKELVEKFEMAKAKGLGSDDLVKIARAAFENNIDTVLIEEDRIIPGKIDPLSGKLERGDLIDPDVDDILDDLGEMAFKKGSQVVVLPKERMPSDTGAAAIFKYKAEHY